MTSNERARAGSLSPGLSRELIVATALDVLQRSDNRSVSLRRIAAELEVTPMALYRHIDSRDELLIAVADRLITLAGNPNKRLGWRRYLEALADGLRELLIAWPVLAEVVGRRPLTSPAAVERLVLAVEVLQRDGFGRTSAIEAYATVHTYTIGFCTLESGRAHYQSRDPASIDWPEAAIEDFVSPRQFKRGLRLLLAGLEPTTRQL